MRYHNIRLDVAEYGYKSLAGDRPELILPVVVSATDSDGYRWAIGEGEDGCLWAAAAEACSNARRFLRLANPKPEAAGTLWEVTE